MIQNFQEKYSQTMEDMSASCHLPPTHFSNKFGNLPKPDPLAGLLEWMRGAWMSFCIYPLVVGLVFTMTMLLAEENRPMAIGSQIYLTFGYRERDRH